MPESTLIITPSLITSGLPLLHYIAWQKFCKYTVPVCITSTYRRC